MTRTRTAAAALVAAVALGLAACGGESTTAEPAAAPTQTTAATSTVAGPSKKLDPNTASEAELMTIPGVGDNIAHEIEEYRPYDAQTGPAKFREEMSKYISDEEIERIMGYLDFGS